MMNIFCGLVGGSHPKPSILGCPSVGNHQRAAQHLALGRSFEQLKMEDLTQGTAEADVGLSISEISYGEIRMVGRMVGKMIGTPVYLHFYAISGCSGWALEARGNSSFRDIRWFIIMFPAHIETYWCPPFVDETR